MTNHPNRSHAYRGHTVTRTEWQITNAVRHLFGVDGPNFRKSATVRPFLSSAGAAREWIDNQFDGVAAELKYESPESSPQEPPPPAVARCAKPTEPTEPTDPDEFWRALDANARWCARAGHPTPVRWRALRAARVRSGKSV